MFQPKPLLLASLLLAVVLSPVKAAEREDVRKVISLVASVKMPYPENSSSQSSEDGARLARP